jgi:hypothetical protein
MITTIKAETIFNTKRLKSMNNDNYYNSVFDGSFDTIEEAKETASKFCDTLYNKIKELQGVKIVSMHTKQIDWGVMGDKTGPDLPVTQFRIYTTIEKEGRKTTKNDIYKLINSLRVSHYN